MVVAEGLDSIRDPETPTTSHPKAPSHGRGSRLLGPPTLGRPFDSTMTLIFLLV